ncbi:MAG: hypothetical protein WD696_10020 [Bryobacteraceae bacterium]
MSEQLLLQGQILGIEEFLLSPSESGTTGADDSELLSGRSQWITLLCEVLPRALLAELGLARILLGSSGGGQFLLILPLEARQRADNFLQAAAGEIRRMSRNNLSLLWGKTEILGDWSTVRKRLSGELKRKNGAPLAAAEASPFEPFVSESGASSDEYFASELGHAIRGTSQTGWSPETPGKVLLDAGKHRWQLSSNLSSDGIAIARHAAPDDDGGRVASLAALASRAEGRCAWGVLRGDVDNFGIRLRRLHNIEEHVQLSVLYKQFFAGELEVLCSLPEFWRKVSILYAGGDDFAVYGAWDALIPLAREIQRLFHRFAEENLKEFPGPEGKTISMALAIAPEVDSSLGAVYQEAGRKLDLAKSTDKDCIYLLGRVLEWKHLAGASDLKDMVARMVSGSRHSRQFLYDLEALYRKASGSQKMWRFHRRFQRVLGGTRDRELQKLRSHIISEPPTRSGTDIKLRPAGLVALEWAKMATEV